MIKGPFIVLLFATLLTAVPDGLRAQPGADLAEFFELKIRPVLQTRCVKCHGPDKASSQLRLDSRQALLKGGQRGPAIVPGRRQKSRLLVALRQQTDDLKMPPDGKVSAAVIRDFKTWLDGGAVWPSESARTNTSEKPHSPPGHWAFQQLRRVEPPDVPDLPTGHPIDRFINAKLLAKGLTRGRLADRRTLARRVTYDLIGLPPTPDELSRFLADDSSTALSHLVDRLLASPRYGERWGRHWLDVARYADTIGNNADYPVPEAHLYRDYVIDSFARDRPYDQFVQQQLAGDILAPNQPQNEFSENVIATGFVALSRQFGNYRHEAPHLVIEDTLDVIGRGLLGLTLRCVRCHDHKFDPISSRDYYGLYGIFASTQYPFAGSEAAPFADQLIPVTRPTFGHAADGDDSGGKIADLRSRINAIERDSDEARKLHDWKTKANQLLQRIHELERLGSDAAPLRDELSRIDLYAAESYLGSKTNPLKQQIDRLERLAVSIKAFAVAEGEPRNARVQQGGDPTRWGDVVSRRFPHVLSTTHDPAIPDSQSGRLQLARWLTRPDTPAGSLLARVMVNRIWQWHFGKGLVTTPSSFGYQGAAPTHPDLLDWLAARFIASRWSIKEMHRLILSSSTWQLASDHDPRNDKDAANRWYWRFDRRRLDAESIRDAMLAISGNLDVTRPGRHPFPDRSQFNYTQHNPFQAVYPSQHRSVYLMTQRFQRHPYLSLFDAPDTNTTASQRRVSTVPLQALYLMNNKFVFAQSEALARRLITASNDRRQRIQLAHSLAWARPATAAEVDAGVAYVTQYSRMASVDPELKAWASFGRIMLTANDFVYVD